MFLTSSAQLKYFFWSKKWKTEDEYTHTEEKKAFFHSVSFNLKWDETRCMLQYVLTIKFLRFFRRVLQGSLIILWAHTIHTSQHSKKRLIEFWEIWYTYKKDVSFIFNVRSSVPSINFLADGTYYIFFYFLVFLVNKDI